MALQVRRLRLDPSNSIISQVDDDDWQTTLVDECRDDDWVPTSSRGDGESTHKENSYFSPYDANLTYPVTRGHDAAEESIVVSKQFKPASSRKPPLLPGESTLRSTDKPLDKPLDKPNTRYQGELQDLYMMEKSKNGHVAKDTIGHVAKDTIGHVAKDTIGHVAKDIILHEPNAEVRDDFIECTRSLSSTRDPTFYSMEFAEAKDHMNSRQQSKNIPSKSSPKKETPRNKIVEPSEKVSAKDGNSNVQHEEPIKSKSNSKGLLRGFLLNRPQKDKGRSPPPRNMPGETFTGSSNEAVGTLTKQAGKVAAWPKVGATRLGDKVSSPSKKNNQPVVNEANVLGNKDDIWGEIIDAAGIIAQHFEVELLELSAADRQKEKKEYRKALVKFRWHAKKLNMSEKELFKMVREEGETLVTKPTFVDEEFVINATDGDSWSGLSALDDSLDRYIEAFEGMCRGLRCGTGDE
jgi:hypothetical protein